MSNFKVAFLLPAYFGSNHSIFLGVGYLVSSVKKDGNDAIVIDEDAIVWIYSNFNKKTALEKAEQRVISEINKYLPNMICLSINTANYKNAIRMLTYVKKSFPDIYIVVGGPHISTCYSTFHEWHKKIYDAAVIGEGEKSICDLINCLKKGKKEIPIPGIYYNNSNIKFINNEIVNLENLPFPDRQAFFYIYNNEEKKLVEENYNRVFYSSLPGFENGHARIVASRGCYNNCSFCSPSVYWKNPQTLMPHRRIRSAKSIVDEIEFIVSQGIKAIYFDDPTFPIKSNLYFFDDFEKEILKRDIKIHWGAPICSDEIDNTILDRLQNIGFSYTYFGLENYKEENLKLFHKRQNILKSINLIYECKKRGIHCDASYQIGLPGESKDDIKKSIDWIFNNNIEQNTFYSITAIWPETLMAKKYNVTPVCYEPEYDKKIFEKSTNLYFYEQGNDIIEQFYSNCSETYHFIPIDLAIKAKYYIFDCGLTNRFLNKK